MPHDPSPPIADPVTMCMRWFGPHDPVALAHVAQVPGVEGIVSSVSDVPAGQAWAAEQVAALKDSVEVAGLRLEVIESIPVSEEIKLGDDVAEAHFDAWCESLEAVASQGIKTVCYNFMPVSDWIRTDLALELADGSTTLAYAQSEVPAFEQQLLSGSAGNIRAWEHLDLSRFSELRDRYTERGESGLWEALGRFLERVTPVASSLGLRLGIHPDDPCWSVLGLPRIITSPAAMLRVCDLVDDAANGVTYCTGSLGCDPENDLVTGARDLAKRVSFVHARNVKTTSEKTFHESAHPTRYGQVDLPAVLRELIDGGFRGPMRPDHGRMIWGEEGNPGYGLYDRSLGATYLLGVIEGLKARS
ncbi:MAG: mannonate dehydratase [Planctomycetota bacterium]